MGNAMGNAIGSAIGNALGNSIGNSIGNPTGNSIGVSKAAKSRRNGIRVIEHISAEPMFLLFNKTRLP